MRAVNLIPEGARGGRGNRSRQPGGGLGAAENFGPAQVAVIVLVVVVALVTLRVLADNRVNDKQATLAAVRTQVSTEQAQATKLSVYTSFIANVTQREAQIRTIAEQRFPWKGTFDQISEVMPASTSLTSLGATTSAPAPAASTAASGPTFTLAGCAHTANQNGVATLLRRLQLISGVTNVGFQSSTRSSSCGDSFNVTLGFAAPGTTPTGPGTSTAVPTSTSGATGSAAGATGTTTGATVAPITTTTPAPSGTTATTGSTHP
ncbi:PilN domain-containing protein [Conexibacter sp. DBS9H8]|uniref:PilN domain-containing protein n=1 Tax=Conexibacter sp. DBS9H8 TaxID=2937801 RepID=UPI00200DA88C|nr:PilN domain-containing protein [Conexibacter sp. DBS9H8]